MSVTFLCKIADDMAEFALYVGIFINCRVTDVLQIAAVRQRLQCTVGNMLQSPHDRIGHFLVFHFQRGNRALRQRGGRHEDQRIRPLRIFFRQDLREASSVGSSDKDSLRNVQCIEEAGDPMGQFIVGPEIIRIVEGQDAVFIFQGGDVREPQLGHAGPACQKYKDFASLTAQKAAEACTVDIDCLVNVRFPEVGKLPVEIPRACPEGMMERWPRRHRVAQTVPGRHRKIRIQLPKLLEASVEGLHLGHGVPAVSGDGHVTDRCAGCEQVNARHRIAVNALIVEISIVLRDDRNVERADQTIGFLRGIDGERALLGGRFGEIPVRAVGDIGQRQNGCDMAYLIGVHIVMPGQSISGTAEHVGEAKLQLVGRSAVQEPDLHARSAQPDAFHVIMLLASAGRLESEQDDFFDRGIAADVGRHFL